MKLKKKSTDELIAKIKELGVKLPIINYEFNSFEADILKNEKIGDRVIGFEIPKLYRTFREACITIIEHYDQ